MRTRLSSPTPDGHLILLRMPEGGAVEAQFLDEEGPRDLTAMACDLALIGLDQRHRRAEGLEGVADDLVEVARLGLQGCSEAEVVCLYVHHASGTVVEFPWFELVGLVSMGVAAQVTSGVAAEMAQEALD